MISFCILLLTCTLASASLSWIGQSWLQSRQNIRVRECSSLFSYMPEVHLAILTRPLAFTFDIIPTRIFSEPVVEKIASPRESSCSDSSEEHIFLMNELLSSSSTSSSAEEVLPAKESPKADDSSPADTTKVLETVEKNEITYKDAILSKPKKPAQKAPRAKSASSSRGRGGWGSGWGGRFRDFDSSWRSEPIPRTPSPSAPIAKTSSSPTSKPKKVGGGRGGVRPPKFNWVKVGNANDNQVV